MLALSPCNGESFRGTPETFPRRPQDNLLKKAKVTCDLLLERKIAQYPSNLAKDKGCIFFKLDEHN